MEDVPCLVSFSSVTAHDRTFIKELDLNKGSFVVLIKLTLIISNTLNGHAQNLFCDTSKREHFL